MTIAAWPIVARTRLVRAFRPGETSSKEAPYRTLRAHGWATPGMPVVAQRQGRAEGRLTVFSVLNVEAARLARHGEKRAAVRAAELAAELEATPEFDSLRHALASVPLRAAAGLLEGDLPVGAPGELFAALQAVARRTRKAWRAEPSLRMAAEMVTGRISRVLGEYVLVAPERGDEMAVPRWMATAAHRTGVGEALGVITDKLDGAQAMVEVVPGIEMGRPMGDRLTPYGRGAPVLALSSDDEHILSRPPAPLRVLVPVTIGR